MSISSRGSRTGGRGDVVDVDLLEIVLWDFGVRGVAARPDVWHATVAAKGVCDCTAALYQSRARDINTVGAKDKPFWNSTYPSELCPKPDINPWRLMCASSARH